MPSGSPAPAYNPSSLQISTVALEARDVISIGGWLDMGTPPTPIPKFAWIGIFATSQQAFVKVIARARFQGQDRLVLIFTTGPNIVTPAFSAIFI